MLTVEGIQHFLEANEFEREERAVGTRPFVTVSREAGAGGTTLAGKVAQRLSAGARAWQVLDQELVEAVSADVKVERALGLLLEEEYVGAFEDYLRQILADAPGQMKVLHRLFKTVYRFAGLGNVVLVGRGGAFLTRGLPGGVHVRLVAPREERIERLMAQKKLSRADAGAKLDGIDRARAALTQDYFHKDIADPAQYHAVFNTGKASLDAIADAVAALVRGR